MAEAAAPSAKRVLVTGGYGALQRAGSKPLARSQHLFSTGLVGKAIEAVVAQEARSDESYVFLGSKDADLT
jgi:hypothetical protein